MASLNKGDVVRLKSGGPWMTIEQEEILQPRIEKPKYDVDCVWFDGSLLRRAFFLPVVLEKQITK